MERDEIKSKIADLYEQWKTKCAQRDPDDYCFDRMQPCGGSDFAHCFKNYLLNSIESEAFL